MPNNFPTPRLRRFYWGYTLLWAIMLPFSLLYLLWRARRDWDYIAHLGERFGLYQGQMDSTVWVHAVSLGEIRSAVPLIRALLDRGETVVTTHFTPAGRREAEKVFAADIAAGRIRVVWVPFEFGWVYRRFFCAFQPKYGLVMEIEIWPSMIRAAHRADIPLLMCNAQYPRKSFERDTKKSRWRADVMRGFAGALVKSDLQRDRFASVGVQNIVVTGELRFDQAIPENQVQAGLALRQHLPARAITITSVVKGEDTTYIDLIRATRDLPDAPVFIYVPRAPERFDDTAQMLTEAGLRVARRSAIMDDALQLRGPLSEIDVLLGDSMGEMYAYLAACDQAIIGGSFHENGAHNISEPLALHKPVIVGPHVWTIEFPVVEAIAAGACQQVQDSAALIAAIRSSTRPDTATVAAFFDTQSGAVAATLAGIDTLIGPHTTSREFRPTLPE